MHVLYFNGLGPGKTRKREELAMRYLAKHDLHVTHHGINWRSGESFNELLDKAVKATKDKLKAKGRLALVGSSAGGSMAINVFSQLQDENLLAVSLCGRLHPGNLGWWDWRDLKRMAHLGTKHASQSFYDAVVYCDKVAIPALRPESLRRITTTQQIFDFVVPKHTMEIPGVEPTFIPAIGHGMGIGMAVYRLPQIVEKLNTVV
jgi:hypothetical protein